MKKFGLLVFGILAILLVFFVLNHLPFKNGTSLKGLVTPIQASASQPVNQITFNNNEVSEPLQQNALNILFTPNTDAITDGAPLSQAITAGKDVYGYKYASGDAKMEFAAKATYDNGGFAAFLDLFPGEFFASDTALASDQALAAFMQRHPEIVVHPLSDVTLDKNARYAIVTPNADTAFTVSGLAGECTPSAMTLMTEYADYPGSPNDIAVSGNYGYFTTYSDSGLTVLDLSDPAHPQTLSTIDIRRIQGKVVIQGNYAYIASGAGAIPGLSIVDISNPLAPRLVGEYHNDTTSYFGIAVAGNYAYLASGLSGYQVLDISNPAHPILTTSDEHPAGIPIVNIVKAIVQNKTLYLSEGLDILFFDLTDPAHPVYKSLFAAPEGVDVSIGGNDAYVTTDTEIQSGVVTFGLLIVDISNPLNPTLLSKYDFQNGSMKYIIGLGDNALVGLGDNALVGHFVYAVINQFTSAAEGYAILDVRNATAPEFLLQGPVLQQQVTNFKVIGSYAYVFGSDGIEIYRLNCH